jgi:phosphoribosyl-AMP cyclohydrolase
VPASAPSDPASAPRQGEPIRADLAELLAGLKFDAQGLVTAVIQDHADATVLMVGWMDAEAVRRTLTTGRTWFWSRSRREYWQKGETSGHRQYVRSVHADCDRDALLVRVEQVGGACHTGARSCFEEALPAVTGSSVAGAATGSSVAGAATGSSADGAATGSEAFGSPAAARAGAVGGETRP